MTTDDAHVTKDRPKHLRFELGLLISVGIMFLSSIGLVVPLVGPIFAYTLGPLLAGYVGGKYILRWDSPVLAFLASAIVTGTQVGLVLFVLNQLPMIVHVQLGRQEWGLMIALFLLNLTFCFLGALGSGRPISALEEG